MHFLQFPIILLFLASQALPCLGVQELHISPETAGKISAAAQRWTDCSHVFGAALSAFQAAEQGGVFKGRSTWMQCSAQLDILFLLDGSNSIGKGSFERSKHFAVKLCDALDLSPDRVRVGVVQYSATPHLEFRLDSAITKQETKEKIKAIVFKGGSTQTGLALKYVLRKGFPGGRNSSVPKLLIILSDGKSQGNLVVPAALLKERAIKIFAVGVKFPRWAELHALASKPMEEYVLFAEHVDDAINGLTSTLTNSTVCSAVPAGCRIQLYPCERRTLETVKELTGNYVCWKGSTSQSGVFAGHCPFYSWKRFFNKHQAQCYRTVCPDPCDSQPCRNSGTCIPEGLDQYHCVCPVGFGGDTHCAPKQSLECNVDLLFLVDSSAAASLEGFMRHKSFLKRFIQAGLSEDSPVNVGVATYSNDVKMVVKIGEYPDIPELLKYIDSTRFMGGGTFTGKALRYVTQYGFKSTPAFADVRDDLPRVVVLLTGSISQDSVLEPAKYARDHEVFLVGVTSHSSKEEMFEIVGNPQQMITYSNPQELFNQLPQLQKKICSVDVQGCQSQALDLVFVLDASAAVGQDHFNLLRNFVTSFSLQFDINRDVTQVGLVTYSSRAKTIFGLDAYDTTSSLLHAISQASYIGGSASAGSALLHVYNDVMTVQRGARPGVNKAVMVITDGRGAEDASVPAQKLRDNGIFVFAIGIGDIQRNTLLRISGSDKFLTLIPSYEVLNHYEDDLVQRVCDEAKAPVNLCKPSPCMNDGVCILRNGSYRCECHGWEGPHCESRILRGDTHRPLGLMTKIRNQRTAFTSQRRLKTSSSKSSLWKP